MCTYRFTGLYDGWQIVICNAFDTERRQSEVIPLVIEHETDAERIKRRERKAREQWLVRGALSASQRRRAFKHDGKGKSFALKKAL